MSVPITFGNMLWVLGIFAIAVLTMPEVFDLPVLGFMKKANISKKHRK